MTYLSQLLLNPRNSQVQRDLSDCHRLHRTVLRAFLDVPEKHCARTQFNVLHRVDGVYHGRSASVLLVQSSAAPNWEFLPSSYLEGGTSAAVKRVDAVYEAITAGRTLRFRLRANPTKRVWKADDVAGRSWKGKRVDLRREEDQLAWLSRKGQADPLKERGGFQLLDVRIRPDEASIHADVANVALTPGDAVHGRRQGATLTFGSVVFDGVLRVTDARAFNNTLVTGIGSGKAYGFGLLSIAPA
jgi:CRISPR system Cascade subunit CasE